MPDRADGVYVQGTYDGAPGTYYCQTGCSSTNDGSGSPSNLGGTWTFTPDKGAMVSQPDANYLYYGWWVRKDGDGEPTVASAFAGITGDVDNVGDTEADTDFGTALSGSATYAGHAVGKFAVDYSRNKAANGTSHGGHFTADAELTAKFGGDGVTGAGMTGTIDNFRLNDGTEDPGWSVALHRAGWSSSAATFATPETDAADTTADETMGTTWSIDGTSANRSGTWSGTMYDELPGNPPNGDGNNIPTTVTGTFYSEYSDVGRMVGAFGADKQ